MESLKEWLEIQLEFPDPDYDAKLSKEENASIDQGLQDINEGKVHTNEEVKKSIREEFGL